ncbi:MAG: serine/threonine-protein kinase, partial [Kofleriaceae bacterium]
MPALGRYELLRPLARGGMAEVFLARRRVGGVEKRLVVKRLRRDHQRDPRFLELFVREAQLSMSLVHQNIVPVFDFGRIGDDVFLAMEHIDGKDLGSTLARQRGTGMPPLLAAFIAHECCEALDHAHSRPDGVIHRDVTARNVLLSWAGEVKLADFGIAAVIGELAGAFGTPGYMAPEQANGQRVDARADVYALGLVLWEALIGEHVRPTADRQATLDAAKSGELPAIDESIPAALATIIRSATTRDPGERMNSARAMAEALDSYIVGERAHSGGPAPAKRLAEWLSSRWGADRDEPEPDAPLAPAGGVVTFLDDGVDSIAGHTQRSAAETAAAS